MCPRRSNSWKSAPVPGRRPFLVEHVGGARCRSPYDRVAAEVHRLGRRPPCRTRAPSPRSVRQRRDRTGHCRSPGRPRNRWPRACPMPTGRGRSARSPTDPHREAVHLVGLFFAEHGRRRTCASSAGRARGRRRQLRRRSPTPFASADHAAAVALARDHQELGDSVSGGRRTSRRVPRHRATRP